MVRRFSPVPCVLGLHSASLLVTLSFLIFVGNLQQRTFAQATSVHSQKLVGALPPNARLRLGTTSFCPPSTVYDLVLSPDGSSIVTAGGDLIVWDVPTGQERWRAERRLLEFARVGSGYGIRAVAFSSDSSQFYTPGNGVIHSWDTKTGEHREILLKEAKIGRVKVIQAGAIDVTRDGKRFAIGGANALFVCDDHGKYLFQIANQIPNPRDEDDRLSFTGEYCYGRFSPDGKILAVVTSNRPKEIRLHDAITGQELNTIKLSSKLVRMDFSPDGKEIVATERDSAVRLYDTTSGKPLWSHIVRLTNPFENYTSAVAFSPDGKSIVAAATDHRLYLLDPRTGVQAGVLVGHHWNPWALAFSSDSKTLYSSGWDKLIRSWDIASRKQLQPPVGAHATSVVAISPDGQSIAYADDQCTIRIISAKTGAEQKTLRLEDMEHSQLMFSPDSRQLAAGGDTNEKVQVVVWDVTDGKQRHLWSWPKGKDPHSTVESLSFTADGRQLAAAVFRQDAVYAWDLVTGEQTAELPHQEVYGISFSPDGKTLATAGWDSIVRFWDTASWSNPRELNVEDHQLQKRVNDLRMYAVCCSPDGRLVATAHMDGKVRIWDAKTLGLRSEMKIAGSFAYGAMSFSPDGLWLSTGATGGLVELWDPYMAKKVCDVGSHQAHVYTVQFGRDGRTLVSGGDDHFSYLWQPGSSTHKATQSLDELWEDLAGDDSVAAYQAMCLLSDRSAEAVELVAAKLNDVQSTLHPEDFVDSVQLSAEEIEKKIRMMKLLTKKNPKVLFAVTARRAVAILGQIGTDEAKRILGELAQKESNGELSQYATGELRRFELTD